jgi:hypothetical protein
VTPLHFQQLLKPGMTVPPQSTVMTVCNAAPGLNMARV